MTLNGYSISHKTVLAYLWNRIIHKQHGAATRLSLSIIRVNSGILL
jgi:hypothetical protein